MKTLFKLTPISRSPLGCGFFILPIALCWLALSPALEAGCPSLGGCAGANTAVGDDALFNVTSGVWNVGVGFQALLNDTIGNQNTAIGYQALLTNVSGNHSTAIGGQALQDNTTGNDNVGVGFQTLSHNTTGDRNTGMGYRTLAFNSTANDNTAIGWNALYNNRGTAGAGEANTAVGSQAVFSNTTGNDNTAIGSDALIGNMIGSENTAVGSGALSSNTADNNTAVGSSAMASATGGGVVFNTAVGWNALVSTTANANVAVGDLALENDTSGFFNVAIGAATGINQTTGNNNIYIGQGSFGVAGESNTCYIQSIYNNIQPVVGVNPDFVTVNSSGKLGRANISSRRYKHDIKPMDKVSEKLYALKPVSFHYNKEYDATQTIAFGLIAEDVAQVYPDLVGRNPDGQPESVRYEQINAMLLNEFLKEHKKVQEQQASIAQLKKDLQATAAQQQEEIKALTATLKEQAKQIERVNALVPLTKPVPQLTSNN
jgi:Chaperone of endosialidase